MSLGSPTYAVKWRRWSTAAKDASRANQWWYGHFKLHMMQLAGDLAEREDSVIRSSESYDLAYRTLYDLLPPCRHEGGCYWGPEKSVREGN